MSLLPIHYTAAWESTFSGGHIGLLLIGPVDNHRRETPLDEYKRQLETSLRDTYAKLSRAELQALAIFNAYKSYYRQFRKTYHVQLQFESVVHKGKSLPNVNPLVDACFAAELQTHLLTASHDADKLQPPVKVDASTGQEELFMMNGQRKQIKAKDMMMTDASGVICTIIYGQDRKTAVIPATQNVLYVTYAPVGISREDVNAQHQALIHHVHLFAPGAPIQHEEIVTASG